MKLLMKRPKKSGVLKGMHLKYDAPLFFFNERMQNMDAKKVLIFISGLVSGVVGVGTIIGILLQSKNFCRWFAKKTINFIFGDDFISHQLQHYSLNNIEFIRFSNQQEAYHVLSEMESYIQKYGFVTVLDMYDIVDLFTPYTAANYGWTNLKGATVSRINSTEFYLNLPVPIKLK